MNVTPRFYAAGIHIINNNSNNRSVFRSRGPMEPSYDNGSWRVWQKQPTAELQVQL